MQCKIYRRHEYSKAKGLCVIIDVLRAFTTAAFAFAAGVKEIIFVSTPEEAFDKHREDGSLKLMGETFGRIIPGFHYGNSPTEFENLCLENHRMVQRTSAGTQGVINCKHADQLLIASFVVAEATIKRIKAISPKQVSFIATGVPGEEDLALAEYLMDRLKDRNTSVDPFLERVRKSKEGRIFSNPLIPEFLPRDLELALHIDRFSFVMQVSKDKQDLVARRISI